MIVRITSIPPGEAPVKVREKWIGVTLHGKVYGGFPQGAVSRGSVDFQTGVLVDTSEAISYLENHDKGASAWWKGLYADSSRQSEGLVFPQACYEVIEE